MKAILLILLLACQGCTLAATATTEVRQGPFAQRLEIAATR